MGKSIRKLEFLLLWILFLSSLCASLAFTPVDNYLIDCGSSSNTAVETRVFVGDNSDSSVVSTPQTILGSTTSKPTGSVYGLSLYQTARIFNGPSSYTFSIKNPGRHWIRLYFFPFIYQNYNLRTAKFTVSTQEFTLLNDFQIQNGSVVKEYSLNVSSNTLFLNFVPSNNSLAFVNAIEVVSAPDDLIPDAPKLVNSGDNYQGLSKHALEKVYRVNMGGPKVSPSNDTLSRTWDSDLGYLLHENLAKAASGLVSYQRGGPTEDTAPNMVYGTAQEMSSVGVLNMNFNITWEFDVDLDYLYFIRMHFCDIVSTSLDQLYFNVYIGDWPAHRDLDLSDLTTRTLAAPYILDFVTPVNSSNGLRKLRVSVGPSSDITGVPPNAILNGLEVMKVNNSRGSLDGLFSVVPFINKGSKNNIGIFLGSAFGACGAVVLMGALLLIFRRNKMNQRLNSKTWVPISINGGNFHSSGSKFSNGTTTTSSGLNPNVGFRFSFIILQQATNNFDENCVIGVGGFGKVYRGELRDGTEVAVKRGNPRSQQGLNEFLTEIEMLSKFRHRHLVSLIGYCDEHSEMILVYEYMANGTLKNHLYGSDLPNLSWKQRLEICIGSAKGLHYLHTGSTKSIIHRDVKSANILLDENLMAKVADFGLSKTGPELDQTHVSTAVKGSFGYLDPEYFRRQQLTEKSDVYSFGVVLLEVLCARTVIDPSLPREQVNIAEWAMKWQKKGQLEKIIDPRLTDKINSDSLRKFGETIEKCLVDYGVDRPTMGDVLWNLEYCLQLQETATTSEPDEDSTNQIAELPLRASRQVDPLEASAVEVHDGTSSVDDLSGISMSKVFSQMVSTEGR